MPEHRDRRARWAGRFSSLGAKLTAATLLVLAVVACGTYMEVSRAGRESLLRSKEVAATMVAGPFSAGLAAPLTFGDERGAQEQVGLLTVNDQVVYGAAWSLDSASHALTRLGELRRGGFSGEPAPSPSRQVRTVRSADWILVEAPVVDPTGTQIGVAQVGLSLAEDNAAIQRTEQRTLALSLATALGLALVLTGLTGALVGRPLARLASAARRLQDGEAVDVAIRSNDEVGHLARAFGAMARAIATREERISERNRDLRRVLDTVDEGLVTVDLRCMMSHERSRVLTAWFGAAPESGSFVEYMATIAPAAAPFVRLGWEALRDDVLPVEVVLDQMPHRFARDGRHFEVDYRPIGEAEPPEQVLVVIRDVSQNVERERAEQAQREMATLVKRMLADRSAFDDFVEEGAALVARIEAGGSDLPTTLRDVHTLKGNMALFGIHSITAFCHRLEQRILEDGQPPGPADKAELGSLWAAIGSLLEQLNGARRTGIDLDLAEHQMLLDALDCRLDPQIIRSVVASWRHERASTRVERMAEHVRVLARRLGRGEVDVTTRVAPAGLRLPARRWAPFWTVFAHVVRNTVDHGIEPPEERAARGKPGAAHVDLCVAAAGDQIEVTISDDGPGVNWDAIRARAARQGLPTGTPRELEEALYADGVSSALGASETSGRGVGMGTVRDVVRSCGGRMELSTTPGAGTRLRFVFPRGTLVRGSLFPPVYAGLAGSGPAADDEASRRSARASGAS